jgi:hypothetical protein
MHIQTMSGNAGYRHQLDRIRRFLDRVQGENPNDVAFQDMVWSFFQHCWHLKDWVAHDPLASQAQKDGVSKRAHASYLLQICRDMCNGTKHLRLTHPSRGATGAAHSHVSIVIRPGESSTMDCMIDDGFGRLISGKQLARNCLEEWEAILNAENLNTTRLS